MKPGAAVSIRVFGEVQGVGFRWFVARRASELGVRGFVRNTPNGGVEVYAEAERHLLEALIEQVRSGPPAARVDGAETHWSIPTGAYDTFEIKH